MSHRFFIGATASLFLFFQGCKKKTVSFSPIPAISFVSIAPSTAHEYRENVSITLSYQDGDGNLGDANPDARNVFVTDNRTGVTISMRLPDLSTPKGTPPIEGQVIITLPPPVLNNVSSTSETGDYSVYVKDKAGNPSNTIKTSPITVVP